MSSLAAIVGRNFGSSFDQCRHSSSANVTCIHCGGTKVDGIWSTVYTVASKKS